MKDKVRPFQFPQMRDNAARAWKAQGGRVVGYIGEGVPEALIAAFGFLPYRLAGNPNADLTAINRLLYPIFSKAQSTRGLLEQEQPNRVLAMLLGGVYDFIDYIVVAQGRKHDTQIITQLLNIRAVYPELPLPEMYLLDRVVAHSYAGSLYNRTSIEDFASVLSGWAGQAIDDSAIADAIRHHNKRWNLLDGIRALRCCDQPKISGADAMAIMAASWTMPVADHGQLVEDILNNAGALAKRNGVRLFLYGSAIDYSGLYEAVESSGATVIAESHPWGASALGRPIKEDIPPLDAIAEQFHGASRSSDCPLSRIADEAVSSAVDARVQAAIIYVHRHDEIVMFNAPDVIAGLKGAGIPSLYLQEQPYGVIDPDDLARQVTAFLGGL